MNLKIKTIYKGVNYVIGYFFIDEIYYCDTLEDKFRVNGKVSGETCIPAGIYQVIYSYSPHFKKKTLEILNVPNFEGIRIHSGNTIADTRGCPLVGKNTIKGKLTSSRNVLKIIEKIVVPYLIDDGLVTIEIIR